jgi:hypothetical protein
MARWERGVFLAGRLQDGDAFMSDDEDDNRQGSSRLQKKNRDPEYLKALDTQHWLELVDPYVYTWNGTYHPLTLP